MNTYYSNVRRKPHSKYVMAWLLFRNHKEYMDWLGSACFKFVRIHAGFFFNLNEIAIYQNGK